MKVKAFQIRLAEELMRADEESINRFMDKRDVRKTSTELIKEPQARWSVLVFYNEGAPAGGTKIFFPAGSDLNEEEKRILIALKDWRAEKALEKHVPSYVICSNADLVSVSKIKPQSADELIKIKGFGGQKTAKYGDDIIAVLNSVAS